MNEIANVCELVGADVDQVRKAIGADRRIGTSFLFPGVGYGGSCFPKDVKALLKSAADEGYDFQILQRGRGGERAAEGAARRRRCRRTSATLQGRTIALWGLAFKPRTDDMREAPAIAIIERLLALGATRARLRSGGGGHRRARHLRRPHHAAASKSYDALAGADALAIVTEWNEFREPDFAKMQHAAARRRSSSTAATSTRPSTCARSASPTSPLAAELARGARHRRRRLHRQPRGEGAQPRRLPRRRVRQPRRPATARRSSSATLVEGDIRDVAAVRAALRRHDDRARSCTSRRFSTSASRCATRSRYYRNNVGGALSVLEAMARESVQHFVFSSTCATYGEPIETPITETHPQRPINSYGETKLAVERALPHFERAYGIRCDGAAVLQRRGRRSRRRDRRGSLAGDSPHPARDRGGDRRPRPAGLRRRLPDAGRHLPARLHPRDATWPTRTSGRSRRSSRPGASGAYNLGTGHPHSVREVIDAVERVTGRRGAVDAGAAPAGRSGGAVRGGAQGAGRAALDAAVPGSRRPSSARRGTGTAPIRTGTRTASVATAVATQPAPS